MMLILEDGTQLQGTAFGYSRPMAGEVVFNTGMAGYVETLTDPSYRGQILVLTYPLIGNYGVPAPRELNSLDRPYESSNIQIQGLVVQNYIEHPSHHSATRSLDDWLSAAKVPAISGVDTRALTQKLREQGTMNGWLVPKKNDHKLEEITPEKLNALKQICDRVEMTKDVFYQVAPPEPIKYNGGDRTILLIDIGAKDNIVRSMLERGVNVLRAPWHADIATLTQDVDGILIGNGPGDPKDLGSLIQQLRTLLDTYQKPIFGICLGHQLLSLAAGGDTYKLPYGHRGLNQPVQDLTNRRCFITSQNHGYAVKDDSLPTAWEPWFVNLNDGTNEGIRALNKPFFSVQFHPEAHPGPADTGFLFDEFLSTVRIMARG